MLTTYSASSHVLTSASSLLSEASRHQFGALTPYLLASISHAVNLIARSDTQAMQLQQHSSLSTARQARHGTRCLASPVAALVSGRAVPCQLLASSAPVACLKGARIGSIGPASFAAAHVQPRYCAAAAALICMRSILGIFRFHTSDNDASNCSVMS